MSKIPSVNYRRMRREFISVLNIAWFKEWLESQQPDEVVGRTGSASDKCPIERYLEEVGFCELYVCCDDERVISGRHATWWRTVDLNVASRNIRRRTGWAAHFTHIVRWYEELPSESAVESGLKEHRIRSTGFRDIRAHEAILCLEYIQRWLNGGDLPLE